MVMALLALTAMYTMFEALGRAGGQSRFSPEKLKRIHRINGYLFVVLYLIIAGICLSILDDTNARLSPRLAMHCAIAVTVIILVALKVSFNRRYRQFYGKITNIGITLAILTLVMVALSGAYYLFMTDFGTNRSFERVLRGAQVSPGLLEPAQAFAIPTDAASIERGSALYDENCTVCHDPLSNKTKVGPGHKGILKNAFLPVSHKPATAENIRNQLRNPYRMMPSFDYLSDKEVGDIIAYLNTL